MTEATLADIQAETKNTIDAYLTNYIQRLPEHAIDLKEAMQYALLVGGKRMRPLLHRITAETLGISYLDSLPVAAAIECIHAYSLVHDDLPAMDDDDLRRGQATCHIKYDEATAILAGDALQTLAFEIIADTSSKQLSHETKVKLITCIAKASGYSGMCGGQAIDLAATNQRISLERLTQLHQLKTGALLTACVETATLMTPNIAECDVANFLTYAQSIGLAFQVQDDILDVTASSEVLGKPSGSDQKANKSTYPALLGLQAAREQLQNYHAEALQALDRLPYNTQLLRQFADLMLNRTH
ncbi:polyprenyl synthetase family protein [Alteromonas sp. ASW11-36]|uniref:Polyprenyl synthetase family protein n=1 Tax=Alteromonas arenosi TaxID=3055817 RepID=A0ABT7SUB1_9ALTE|nr:farnesyl diphosphate synthase [Alteromonas sp. ASW11-36]MDM7859782.1 polyprenyl synthetase family protein [Alteromonas sp. ASW11-36]